ncbi:MAG: DNA methyltransferase [Thermoguttaceae bacterium]
MQIQPFQNTLYTNDNLFILHGMNSEIVDLIYLDPPFNSKRTYTASIGTKSAGASFKDKWTWQDVDEHFLDSLAVNYPDLTSFIATVGKIHSKAMMAYLTYMAQRIIEMHRILKPTGSFYLHCDPTASHYLKLLLDEIFGKKNFRNEIIWWYKFGGRGRKDFAHKHDIIFRYVKTDSFTFNSNDVLVPFESKMTQWSFKQGLRPDMPEGKVPEDVWDIPAINSMSKERTGYPTQKPLALLKRIILASSNKDEIVFDPFCGCATTCVAAQQLDRKWIAIDIETQATEVLVHRLSDDAGLFKDFVATTKVPRRTDITEIAPSKSVKAGLYQEQSGHCNACGGEFELRNLEIDHIIPKSKGGGDYYKNYQLLCGCCNKIKGDSPMEYLRMKIEVRQKMMKNRIVFGE